MHENNTDRLDVKKQEVSQVELRSEEVMDILGSIPHWSIHSGSGYLLVLIFLVLTITWFIKYPDVIVAPVVITTEIPPLSVVSPGSGYINLWVKEKEMVQKDQYLGYLTNTSDAKAILSLKNKLDSFSLAFFKDPSFIYESIPVKVEGLGELQDSYNTFIRNIVDYQLANQQQGFQQQIKALDEQISSYNFLIKQTKEKNSIMREDLQLSERRFTTDSILFMNGVLAKSDFEEKKRAYLQTLRDYKNACMGVTTYAIQMTQLQGKVSELTQAEQKQNKDYLVAIEASMKQLDQRIKTWMESYMVKAPISGSVALFKYWTDHQFVKTGEEVLSVIPGNGQFFAMAKAQLAGSGKIKTGQRVNIKLDNYPSAEYGVVNGSVENISLLPRENTYLIRIKFSDGLQTSYGKRIEPRQEMSGQAEIVTKDLRLLERFFYQLRKLVEE